MRWWPEWASETDLASFRSGAECTVDRWGEKRSALQGGLVCFFWAVWAHSDDGSVVFHCISLANVFFSLSNACIANMASSATVDTSSMNSVEAGRGFGVLVSVFRCLSLVPGRPPPTSRRSSSARSSRSSRGPIEKSPWKSRRLSYCTWIGGSMKYQLCTYV